MKKSLWILLLVFLAVAEVCAQEENVSFLYQGHIQASGTPLTGTGYFKLAIFTVEDSEEYVLWTNDGAATAGEPSSATQADVSHGAFSFLVGDISMVNMAPLSSPIFNVHKKIWLRVWFSDGESGFEQLTPDQRIVNPDLIGQNQRHSIDLYVDPDTGNDGQSGMSSGKAKKTIQSAIEALPPVIKKPVVLHLAPGVYYERVLLKNIAMGSSDASLTIQGDSLDASLATISGASATSPTVAMNDYAIRIEDCHAISIKNLSIERTTEQGVSLERSAAAIVNCVATNNNMGIVGTRQSYLEVSDSQVNNCTIGIYAGKGSILGIENCVIEDTTSHGVSVNANSEVNLRYSTIQNTGACGLIVWTHSNGTLYESTVDSCGSASYWSSVAVWGVSMFKIYKSTINNAPFAGVESKENSYVEFREGASPSDRNVISNSNLGCFARYQSSMNNMNANGLVFDNCTKNYNTQGTSYFFNFPANN